MLNRRDLLRSGGLAALGLILPPLTGPTFLSRKLLAGPVGAGTGAKKMIFIWQRGGNDASLDKTFDRCRRRNIDDRRRPRGDLRLGSS
jgi:hypothetical protein